jgi:hypothetical protein
LRFLKILNFFFKEVLDSMEISIFYKVIKRGLFNTEDSANKLGDLKVEFLIKVLFLLKAFPKGRGFIAIFLLK